MGYCLIRTGDAFGCLATPSGVLETLKHNLWGEGVYPQLLTLSLSDCSTGLFSLVQQLKIHCEDVHVYVLNVCYCICIVSDPVSWMQGGSWKTIKKKTTITNYKQLNKACVIDSESAAYRFWSESVKQLTAPIIHPSCFRPSQSSRTDDPIPIVLYNFTVRYTLGSCGNLCLS